MFKKAQTDIRELIMTIVIVGILFIVGLLIFANVSNSTNNILDADTNTATNESITVTTKRTTVVNETITMASQEGTVSFAGISSVTFFGNVSNNTNLASVSLGVEVNFTRSGRIIIDAAEFPADGEYNVTYVYEANATGQTANADISQLIFFGAANRSTHTDGIDLNEEVNFTTAGVITLSALNFTADIYNISYDFTTESAAQASTTVIQSTVLDSFQLGVIALIVLAAVVILAVLFKLGSS